MFPKNTLLKLLFCSLFLFSSSLFLYAQEKPTTDSIAGDSLAEIDTLVPPPVVEETEEIIAEQKEEDPSVFSRKSPYHVVRSHLFFLQPDNYRPDISSRALFAGTKSQEELEKLTVKLQQIYDGEGYYVDVDIISHDTNYVDSITGKHRYMVFPKYPEIYVEKLGEDWVYSKRTVEAIIQVHRQVYPFGTDLLLNLVPKGGQSKFLGLYSWQYLGMLILVLMSFILFYVFDVVSKFVIRKIPRYFNKTDVANELIAPVARPLSLLVLSWLLIKLVAVLQLPITLNQYVITVLRILPPIFAVIVAYQMVDFFAGILQGLTEKTETNLDDQLAPLVTKILKTIVIVLGIIFVLQNVGVDVTALLAGISIGGLALALAAQDTVKNFLGSVTIFTDRPFQIGDWIDTGSIAGSVEEVGIRSTRIRLPDSTLTTIPNGSLANIAINNGGSARVYRRLSVTFGLTYDTTPDQMERFVQKAKEIIDAHEVTREDNPVYFISMGDFSLNVNAIIYFETTSLFKDYEVRQELFLSIMRMAEEIGVGFAFPTQTLHLFNENGDEQA